MCSNLSSSSNTGPSYNWLKSHDFIPSLFQVALPACAMFCTIPPFQVSFNLTHLHVASGIFFHFFCSPSTLKLCAFSMLLPIPRMLQHYHHTKQPYFVCSLSSLLIIALIHEDKKTKYHLEINNAFIHLHHLLCCPFSSTLQNCFLLSISVQLHKDAKIYLLSRNSSLLLLVAHFQHTNSYC